MENFSINITNIDNGSIEINSTTYQQDLIVGVKHLHPCGDYDNFFRRGKFCIFVGKKESALSIKFFLHPEYVKLRSSTRFNPYPLNLICLKNVQKIMRIYKILEPYNLVPECTRIVSCDVQSQTGYGIEMENLTSLDNPPTSKQKKEFWDKLNQACKTHNLTRHGTLKSIIHDAHYPKNFICTNEGIKLIDIDVMWNIL